MTAVSEDERVALKELWQQRWPACPPIGYKLRSAFPDVWVRFHSLPESQRYAEDESEYAVVLERYNTVLDELFAQSDVYLVTAAQTGDLTPPSPQPGTAYYWMTGLAEDDPDPEFRVYHHLHTRRLTWKRGCIDGLLRDVADDEVANIFVTYTQLRRIYHPYDGGADVLLASSAERDELRDRHADWLSIYPGGL